MSVWLRRVKGFLQRDVWDIEVTALTWVRRNAVRAVRVLLMVLGGFRRDECVLHASSLTFMTLLSFIPVLAIGLSMARSFGDPTQLREYVKENLHEWIVSSGDAEAAAAGDADVAESPTEGLLSEEAKALMMGKLDAAHGENVLTVERLDEMIDTAFERIESLNFGALGGVGVALLVWTVISVLGQVEAAFNRVWGVTKQRTLSRKFTDYLSVVVVVPLLVTAASTIPATSLISRLASSGGVENVAFSVRFLRGAGMLALLTGSLAFALRFLPNAKVRFWPGLWGGFLVAVAMTGWLRLCLTFQIGLAKYSAFFGSFAVVPLLLFWVYVSWIIVLIGAEFSFGLQNTDTYLLEGEASRASSRTRALLALDLAAAAAKSVRTGDGLLRMGEWLQGHRVPVRLVNDVLATLVRHGMLVETLQGGGEFAVRFDVERATVADVLRALMDDGDAPELVGMHVPEASPLGEAYDAVLAQAGALSVRLVELPETALL